MATITIRVDDDTRDALQAKADDERQTLSEFIRDRLQDAVFDFRPSTESDSRLEQPESLSSLERHKLALLHRILARVLPKDANGDDGDEAYQLERAHVLEDGFTNEYWVEFAGLRTELTIRQCAFVMDVLDMFRVVKHSMDHLAETNEELPKGAQYGLSYRGFDHNDALEGQMSAYVEHLINDGKWEEQKEFVLGHERGNSHMPTLDVYSRMLTAYREVQQRRPRTGNRFDHLLNKADLQHIADASVHRSNR